MSNRTVDQYSDPSFRVLAQRIREVPEFEPLIKSASLNAEDPVNLPTSAFAWEERRMFPLHTPEQAALSYLYATNKTAEVPPGVVDALTNALDLYGVKVPDTRVKQAAAAEPNLDDYLLPERRRWVVNSPELVKMAEEALRVNRGSLEIEERVQAAERLVKKAEAYGVKLAADTYRTAGRTMSDLETVRHWVEARADAAPEGVSSAFMKLANELSRVEAVSADRKALVKLASLIGELDRRAGFDTDARHRWYDPIDTVFNTNKIAEPVVELGGMNVPLSKLAALPSTIYADVFGDDVVPELSTGTRLDAQKIAEVLPTMPSDLKSIFARQIRAYV